MNEKVSIIIPTFNNSNTIERCIESALNQTYKNIEIIVVNDGSTDDTINKIRKYKESDCMMIIDKTNSGPGDSRNVGIEIATGDYICFLDSDDYFSENAIEVMIDNILDNIDIIRCNYFTVKMNKITKNKKFPQYSYISAKQLVEKQMMDCGVWNTVWGQLIRTALCKNIKFRNRIRIGEDLLFNYDLYCSANIIKCIDEPLYFYVDNDLSITRALNNISIKKNMEDVLKNYQFLYSKFNESENKIKIINRCVQSIMSYERQLLYVSVGKEIEYIKEFNRNTNFALFLKQYHDKDYQFDVFLNKNDMFKVYFFYILTTYIPLKILKTLITKFI